MMGGTVHPWVSSRLCINLVVAYYPSKSSGPAKFCETSVSELSAFVGDPLPEAPSSYSESRLLQLALG
jgi:hypothetical protein